MCVFDAFEFGKSVMLLQILRIKKSLKVNFLSMLNLKFPFHSYVVSRFPISLNEIIFQLLVCLLQNVGNLSRDKTHLK